MKSKTLAALTMVIGIALSTSVFAQGRHDEKPHAQDKPAAASSEVRNAPGGSGRHDEKPHGNRPPAKKDSAKAAEKTDKGAK